MSFGKSTHSATCIIQCKWFAIAEHIFAGVPPHRTKQQSTTQIICYIYCVRVLAVAI